MAVVLACSMSSVTADFSLIDGRDELSGFYEMTTHYWPAAEDLSFAHRARAAHALEMTSRPDGYCTNATKNRRAVIYVDHARRASSYRASRAFCSVDFLPSDRSVVLILGVYN